MVRADMAYKGIPSGTPLWLLIAIVVIISVYAIAVGVRRNRR